MKELLDKGLTDHDLAAIGNAVLAAMQHAFNAGQAATGEDDRGLQDIRLGREQRPIFESMLRGALQERHAEAMFEPAYHAGCEYLGLDGDEPDYLKD